MTTPCPKCGGVMAPGIATGQTYTAHGRGEIVTMSAGGPGQIIACWKCKSCGWSVTK